MKFRKLFAVILCVAPLAAVAGDDGYVDDAAKQPDSGGHTIYKSVGPDGSIVFSDTPPKGGKVEKVHVGPTNVQPIALPRPLPVRKLSPKKKSPKQDQYQGPFSIAIVSPQDGATIPPGQRFIALQVSVDPVPQDGYRFYAVVDGQPWQGGSAGTSLDISALERGSHSVQAVLTDMSGNTVLAQSQPVTVYVKRPGGTIPDNPAPRATPAPKAPVAPGINPPKKSRTGYNG
ncbi:DUF4124 domain-containing protein [Microbulbifer hainanensis]|uniref:DUF4124 domain-containing protein n=1 Tax=Microbulbifer hainanensis TaxID=2735675 RepID=UPI0018681A5B|nr:DUF4124 domain-containing protein [Microbulbifer hainanensis]